MLGLAIAELELRLENLTSLDCCYQELHSIRFYPSTIAARYIMRILVHLINFLLPICSRGARYFAVSITWLAKLSFIILVLTLDPINDSERKFLPSRRFPNSDLRHLNDRQQQRIWAEHQQMQLFFCSAIV